MKIPAFADKSILWLFLAALSFYLILGHGDAGGGYEPESYRTAKQIVLNGQFTVYDSDLGAVAKSGTPSYARNGILQPLVMIPWYLASHFLASISPPFIGEEWWIGWFLSMVTAVTAVYIYLFVIALGMSKQTAIAGALLAAFTSMLVPYSQIGMEPFQTMWLVMAAYYLYRFKLTSRWRVLLLAGVMAGLLAASKRLSPTLLPPLGLYTLYLLWQKWGWRSRRFYLGGLVWVLPVLMFLGMVVWFNIVRTGRVTGQILDTAGLLDSRMLGLYGYLFSFNKSVFIYSPTLLWMLVGIKRFWTRYRAEAILFLAIMAVPYLIFSASTVWADEVWGPRYLHSSIPFGYIIGAMALEGGFRGVWARVRFVALGAAGAFMQFLGSIYTYGRYVRLLTDAGLNNQVNFLDSPQTAAWWIHLQMLMSQISAWLFNQPIRFDYRVYYFTHLGMSPYAPKNLVPVPLAPPRLDVPSPNLADIAQFDQWWWQMFSTPRIYNDQKVLVAVILAILLAVLAFSLWQLGQEWRACSAKATDGSLEVIAQNSGVA